MQETDPKKTAKTFFKVPSQTRWRFDFVSENDFKVYVTTKNLFILFKL